MRRLAVVSRLLCQSRITTASRAAGSSLGGSASADDVTGSNSFTDMMEKEKASEKSNEAHPLMYNVPALSTRTVGREAEVTALWQNLLSGRQCQLLTGVDGIGKSTIASEFCDAARKSGRFTCIQWFNGQHALDSQLERFFASMRGRKERDVLLVLDDVADPEEAVALLPEHKSLYVIMTSNNSEATQSAKVMVAPTLPLSPKAAEELAVEVDGVESVNTVVAILDTLGFVPLLVNLASLLIAGDVVSSKELLDTLTAKEVMKDGALSVSNALSVLLELAVGAISKEFPGAKQQLATLSCFHLSDISDAVITAVCGDDGAQMAVMAAQLGVFSLKWEDSAFAIHPTIAAVLRKSLPNEDLRLAASALKGMWPRRWRGMGSSLAYNLVWHTYALTAHFKARRVPFSADLMDSMDRSATFLAHSEARDLTIAASLWHDIFLHHQQEAAPTAETVRLARECGRLLHYLRDERAQSVLRAAYDGAVAVHGQDTAEAALIMGCLAPYLPAQQSSVDGLVRSAEVLESRLTSVDLVLSKEERKMLLETIFVLLVCRGQIMEEMGLTVPAALWTSLDTVKERLQPLQPKK